jgi:hypothetical protein
MLISPDQAVANVIQLAAASCWRTGAAAIWRLRFVVHLTRYSVGNADVWFKSNRLQTTASRRQGIERLAGAEYRILRSRTLAYYARAGSDLGRYWRARRHPANPARRSRAHRLVVNRRPDGAEYRSQYS